MQESQKKLIKNILQTQLRLRHDFDGVWKRLLELFLRPFLELCFQEIAKAIDWRRVPQFLDSEFEKIMGKAKSRGWQVERLIRVNLLSGESVIFYLHIEIQGIVDCFFALKIYRSYLRLEINLEEGEEAFGEPLACLGVLTDEEPNWRPQVYEKKLFDFHLRFEFPICKLQDFVPRLEEFEKNSDNPVALFIAAHLRTQQTREDWEERAQWKFFFARRCYELCFSSQDFRNLYLLIDDLMTLPEGLQEKYQQQVLAFEKEKSMPYISQFEKRTLKKGLEKGRQQGLEKGFREGRVQTLREDILDILEVRFDSKDKSIQKKLGAILQEETLRGLFRKAVAVDSLEAFKEAF